MRLFKLMIVDDEPVIRNGMANCIDWKHVDCQVVYVARDGLDAYENIEKYAPDIVITDLRMPELDGISLSKYIYENHKEICVIILSGYSDFSYAQQGMSYGVTNYLLKPVTENMLFDAIEKACGIIESNRHYHEYIHGPEKAKDCNYETPDLALIARKYITENYMNSISLCDIASFLHLNASYLSRLYKRTFGITISDELSQLKIEMARKLLTETDFRAYEIAKKIGINDPVYFAQLFRKHTGINPKEYRRKHFIDRFTGER